MVVLHALNVFINWWKSTKDTVILHQSLMHNTQTREFQVQTCSFTIMEFDFGDVGPAVFLL